MQKQREPATRLAFRKALFGKALDGGLQPWQYRFTIEKESKR